MKTIKLIKIIIILFIISCIISCTKGDKLNNLNDFKKYEIITIDSCEYILWGGSYGYLNITHKGNCKFCTERNKTK